MSNTTNSLPKKTVSKLETRLTFFFVTIGVVSLLYVFDFLPEAPVEIKEEAVKIAEEQTDVEVTESVDPLPVRIIFDTLDKEVMVQNPDTKSVAELDNALLEGVVRHPGSANFSETGTIFILGHSSYLPVVRNKNFQAFNGIQKLKWGDTVRLQSKDKEYVYSVDRVYEAKASDAEVTIEWGTPKLTLATCNSFGSKDDRFVVEATLVSTSLLSEGKQS
jgi:LPXTG-site transpeptidase (sortase) family protein